MDLEENYKMIFGWLCLPKDVINFQRYHTVPQSVLIVSSVNIFSCISLTQKSADFLAPAPLSTEKMYKMFKIYFILTPPLKEMPAKVFIDGNNYQWALLLCIILYCTQNNRIKLFRLNVLFCSFCTNTICSVKPLRHFVKLCCLGGEANNPLYTN